MTRRLRVAVAGLAHFHVDYVLEEARRSPELVEIVGLSDSDSANRENWAVDGVPMYEDHAELLAKERPDAVAVFAEYQVRADIICAALDAGADALVDKPLCTTEEQLAAIEAAAARSGRTVSIIFEKRWLPETLAVKELLESGRIGQPRQFAFTAPHKLKRPTRPDWFFDERYGSIVSDLLSHDIDLFLLLTGERNGTLAASESRGMDPSHPQWADSCGLLLRGDNAVATMEANWLWPAASPYHGEYRLRVTGERGVIEANWARHTVTLLTVDEPEQAIALPSGFRPAADAIASFAEGRPPQVGTAQSLAVARIGLLASRAATQGDTRGWSIAEF